MPGNLFDLKTTGGKRKGGGGGSSILGKIMGVMGGGGSAAVNPEVTNLFKYGEFGNIAGDYDKPQFVPSGNDAMGQSSQQADELNNRYHISKIMAKYNDTLARGALPFQTDEAIRQGQTLDKSRAALAQETAANAKQSKGEDYYRGLESLTDQERQMMFPNNPEVMWEDFGKLAGRMETTYPQVAQEGLRGVLAKLPEQRAGFNYATSPKGLKDAATNAEILANKPLLEARRSSRFSTGDTIFEPGNPLVPSEGGTEMRAGSNKVINRNVPIPQTQQQIDLGAKQEYMKEQELIPTAPSYGVKGSFAPVTPEEVDSMTGDNTDELGSYNQAIRAQPEVQQPAGISGTPVGDKAPPPVVVSAQPQAQVPQTQQYEGILPSMASGVGNAVSGISKLASPAISAIGSELGGMGQDVSAMSKMLMRPKGTTAPLMPQRESVQSLIMKALSSGNESLAEIIQGISPNTVSGDAYPLPADRPKKFPKSMKTKKTPLGLNIKLKDS